MVKYLVGPSGKEIAELYLGKGNTEEAAQFAHADEELYNNGWFKESLQGKQVEIKIPGRKPRWHCTIWPSQVSP